MLKGVFSERPPRPKYESVWKVNQVLTMLREAGDSASLSLQDLTIKTAMLLVLTHPCRDEDLAELDSRNRSQVPEGVVSSLVLSFIKAIVSITFFFTSFEEEKRLCLIENLTLKVYEEGQVHFMTFQEKIPVF